MSNKPGVMMYFELRPSLEKMSDELAGKLFRVMMEYGETQFEPEIPEGLELIWPLIRCGIDRDDKRYRDKSLRSAYNIYVRWEKEKGRIPLSFDEWILVSDSDVPADGKSIS